MDIIETTIRNMISQELDRRGKAVNLCPIDKFCADHDLSRTTIWRARKEGKLKTVNIGSRIFIDLDQFTGK